MGLKRTRSTPLLGDLPERHELADRAGENRVVEPERSLDEMTKTQLCQLASERGVTGRSSMSKNELVEALQSPEAFSAANSPPQPGGANSSSPTTDRPEFEPMTVYISPLVKVDLERLLLDLRVRHRVNLPLSGLIRSVLAGLLESDIDLGPAYTSRDREVVEEEIAKLVADSLGGCNDD